MLFLLSFLFSPPPSPLAAEMLLLRGFGRGLSVAAAATDDFLGLRAESDLNFLDSTDALMYDDAQFRRICMFLNSLLFRRL